jgi:hypothetical protein
MAGTFAAGAIRRLWTAQPGDTHGPAHNTLHSGLGISLVAHLSSSVYNKLVASDDAGASTQL